MKYKNLILVEDDLDDQELFQLAVANISREFSCVVFDNSPEALKQLKMRSVACDILFLDLNMPMVNGAEFLKELRQIEGWEQLPVVVLSTTANPAMIARAHQLGAIGFYTKPGSFSELEDLLRSILYA